MAVAGEGVCRGVGVGGAHPGGSHHHRHQGLDHARPSEPHGEAEQHLQAEPCHRAGAPVARHSERPAYGKASVFRIDNYHDCWLYNIRLHYRIAMLLKGP